jgi:hypothetical protein
MNKINSRSGIAAGLAIASIMVEVKKIGAILPTKK